MLFRIHFLFAICMRPVRMFVFLALGFMPFLRSYDALKESGISHGLCVVLPANDSDLIRAMAADGKMLVHALAADDASLEKARAALQAAGFYGLATASKPLAFNPLPYADNLVNLIVCDADALGTLAPPREEMIRVLEPLGVVCIKQKGEWKTFTKPRPAELDRWTHLDYDAAGTGVSHDKVVKPPTAVQWRMELEPYAGLGGNPAAYRPYTGFRLAGNRAFFAMNINQDEVLKSKNAQVVAVGRDAFNGLPLWSVPQVSSGNGTPQEYQFVVNESRVFTFLDRDTYPVALDAATGAVVATFDKGAKLPASNRKINPGYTMLRATENILIQCAEDKLYAFDAGTAALKWVWEEKDGAVCFPRVMEAEKRVIVQVVEANLERIQGRWANLKTSALLCLDLETGKQIWRSTDVKDWNLGQTITSGDCIFAFNPGGIGASETFSGKRDKGQGVVAKLNAADGKMLWKSEPFKWGYNLIVRDGKPFFATPSELNTLSPEDGKLSEFWRASFNNRCNRTSATDDWIVMGMGNFVNREGDATVLGVSRGGCAQGVTPANGLLYYTPNTCHCITMLRGHLALSPEPVREKIPDDMRLQKSGAFATSRETKPVNMTGLISSEWLPQISYGAPETPPIKYGAREIVSVIHEHRVECREGGKTVWSITPGGRVSQSPIVVEDRCYFGAHDGWLYCVNANDGTLVWRFFAAPYERQLVSHGQLESSWPVYNAVLHGGTICCSAGLHPETGGGIQIWALDPKTGAVAWHKNLKRSPLHIKPGDPNNKKGVLAPNRVMNSPLVSDGTSLSITGITFTVDETEAAIVDRMDHESAGDKNRNWGWSLRGPMKVK
ncbi:MAG: PQQ-binding-like beta-propeller repeat protein [Planctomycetota bacterium]